MNMHFVNNEETANPKVDDVHVVFDRTQIETPILMWSLLFVSLQEMTGSKETFLHTLGLQLSVHQGASESHFTHHGECLFRHYVVFFMK